MQKKYCTFYNKNESNTDSADSALCPPGQLPKPSGRSAKHNLQSLQGHMQSYSHKAFGKPNFDGF